MLKVSCCSLFLAGAPFLSGIANATKCDLLLTHRQNVAEQMQTGHIGSEVNKFTDGYLVRETNKGTIKILRLGHLSTITLHESLRTHRIARISDRAKYALLRSNDGKMLNVVDLRTGRSRLELIDGHPDQAMDYTYFDFAGQHSLVAFNPVKQEVALFDLSGQILSLVAKGNYSAGLQFMDDISVNGSISPHWKIYYDEPQKFLYLAPLGKLDRPRVLKLSVMGGRIRELSSFDVPFFHGEGPRSHEISQIQFYNFGEMDVVSRVFVKGTELTSTLQRLSLLSGESRFGVELPSGFLISEFAVNPSGTMAVFSGRRYAMFALEREKLIIVKFAKGLGRVILEIDSDDILPRKDKDFIHGNIADLRWNSIEEFAAVTENLMEYHYLVRDLH